MHSQVLGKVEGGQVALLGVDVAACTYYQRGSGWYEGQLARHGSARAGAGECAAVQAAGAPGFQC